MTPELTNNEIDAITAAAAEQALNDETDMRKIKETVKVDENAELVHDEVQVPIDNSSSDLVVKKVDTMPSSNINILDIGDDEAEKKVIENTAATTAQDAFNLSDDDTLALLDIISNYNKDPDYPVYKNLPESIKKTVRTMAFEYDIPSSRWNEVAKMLISEMISDATVQEAFVDLEKSLKEALNVPSISDVYSEHIKEVMEDRIPETADKIRDEYPEKAKMLEDIREMFMKSYDFSLARAEYENTARLRKALRRYDIELKRALEEFNFRNQKTRFKMHDVRELPEVLKKILIDDPRDTAAYFYETEGEVPESLMKIVDMKITDADIAKFCILICKSCELMNTEDVVQASYMYYMTHNIIMLKLTQEAKTAFAAELINNICDTIAFIRNKEAEFNGNNVGKPHKSKKSNSK